MEGNVEACLRPDTETESALDDEDAKKPKVRVHCFIILKLFYLTT